jgi:glycosyltransferase involved in cell wall biosynthesis
VKVAFDTRPVSDPYGVGRYSRCLLRALGQTAAEGDELVELRRSASMSRSLKADVFHSPWIAGAMLHSPCPMVVTVHGLAPLKRRSEVLRTGMRLRLRHLAVQRAVGVIVPTEAVARDAVTHLRLERERITVVPEAADEAMYPRSDQEVAAVRSRHSLPERYLLCVGGLEHPDPARHIAELAAAPRELPLVLAGATRPWAEELGGVHLTGRVSDEELAAIYTAAHALVVPSEEEGFGLTAVEALACGTPVAAFESPALREVLGERATFVAASDVEQLLEVAQSARRPAPQALAWTWQDAARATWRVYAAAAAAADEPRTAGRIVRPAGAAGIERLEAQ